MSERGIFLTIEKVDRVRAELLRHYDADPEILSWLTWDDKVPLPGEGDDYPTPEIGMKC